MCGTRYSVVYHYSCTSKTADRKMLYRDICQTLLSHRLVDEGDRVIFTMGDLDGVSGSTNSMRILKVSTSV